MVDEETRKALGEVVRVGYVSSVDTTKRTARVRYPHLGNMVSGNLRVLQQFECQLNLTPDIEGHVHGGSYTTFWMPKVDDMVLCLYVPTFNGDGVILGVLK